MKRAIVVLASIMMAIRLANAEIDKEREWIKDLKLRAEQMALRAERMRLPCLVSWYGKEFAGKKTASGEIFNPADFTCACNFLPFGTLVEFAHQGKSVVVRVNDRGSFDKKYGRHFDLSEAAADALQIKQEGVKWIFYRVQDQ